MRIDAISKGKQDICSIPPYRFDIFGPMDLVEEVVLGYGIQNLEPFFPSQFFWTNKSDVTTLKSVSLIMIGLGFTEALNSSLISNKILYEMTNRSNS